MKTSINIFVIIILLITLVSTTKFTFSTGKVTAETSSVPKKTFDVLTLDQPGIPNNFSKFGGWKNKKTGNATGFFHSSIIDKIWWIVDPEGYLFLQNGINSVNSQTNISIPKDLIDIGINTLGSWTDVNFAKHLNIAFTPQLNIMLNFKSTSDFNKNLFAAGLIPVFDPELKNFCEKELKYLSELSSNQFLLGYFTDNELPLYHTNILDGFLKIDNKSNPNFVAVNDWMIKRKGKDYKIDDIDRNEFLGFLSETYYRSANECVKMYDKNHMIIGSRLHGGSKTNPLIFKAAGKYVDIVSVNVYDWWTLNLKNKQYTTMWYEQSQKPFMVTEFYAKSSDTGMKNQTGAGWLVSTQNDRGKFFQNFVIGGLQNPGAVGFHHFKFQDDTTKNAGIISLKNHTYLPLIQSFYKIYTNIYELRTQLVLPMASQEQQQEQKLIIE